MKPLEKTGTVRSLVVYVCVATVLLVAGLQATHIHRDWLNRPSHSWSEHVAVGSDSHCVLCVGTFSAAIATHVDLAESLASQSASLIAPAPVPYDRRVSNDITIRPPPAL